MNRKWLAATMLILLGASQFIAGQGSAVPPDKRGDYDRALVFLHELQTALRSNNPVAVERFVHYPLRADVEGHGVKIRNRAAFLRTYPKIFTPARRAAVLKARDSDLWWRDQGYSLPEGVIWFDAFMPLNQQFPPADSPEFWQVGKLGLITINPTSQEVK
jgi:hypothetical protein